jgi:hypothetical protein
MNLSQSRTLFQSGTRLIRNLILDLRYRAFLGGTVKSPYAKLGIADTANTDYGALPLVFGGIIQGSDVLVDIGCGKGRVINWWLSQGLRNRIVGIELDETVALKTQRRLRRFHNVQIVAGDALAFLPTDGTLFYLFNPFSEPWVKALKDRLAGLFALQKARMVLYYNCLHVNVFRSDLNWSVDEIELGSQFHRLALMKLRNPTARIGREGDLDLANGPQLSS